MIVLQFVSWTCMRVGNCRSYCLFKKLFRVNGNYHLCMSWPQALFLLIPLLKLLLAAVVAAVMQFEIIFKEIL